MTAPRVDAHRALDPDALRVVANPEQYAHRPLLRRLAWIVLMTGRGNVVDQARLAATPVEVAND